MRKVAIGLVCIILFSFLATPAWAAEESPYTPNVEVTAKSAYLINIDTGTLIYQKNPNEKINSGPLNKLMAIILALETAPDIDATKTKLTASMQDELYRIGKGNIALAGISLGEELTIRQLIYATLMQSANEAAMMLANYVGDGSIDYYLELANKKAQEIGAVNTHFANSHGLYDEGNYTTAYDMYLITKYAIDNIPQFMELASQTSYATGPTNKHENLQWNSYNYMMVKGSRYYYAPLKGIIVGSLSQVGRYMISTATLDGNTYMLVLMGADFDEEDNLAFTETRALYNWVFDSFRVKTLLEVGESKGEAPLKLAWKKDHVKLISAERFTALVPDEVEVSSIQYVVGGIDEPVRAPVKKGQEIGYVSLMLAGEEIGRVPLVSAESVEANALLVFTDKIEMLFASFWFKFVVVYAVLLFISYVFIMILRNKNKQRYRTVRHRKKM